jgi:hypothetical protein
MLQVVRRTPTIAHLMNTLKRYYWVVPPADSKTSNENNPRLDRSVIVHIRTSILQLVNLFMYKLPADCEEKDINRDEEFQCILNYIAIVHEVAFAFYQTMSYVIPL